MGKGTLYFFTGLAGAGKSTIGGLFYERLKERKPDAVLIDGHVERENAAASGIPRDYSLEARLAGARGLFQHCRNMTEQGRDVVCCSMSLFAEIREWNRKNIENYQEIYLKTSMDVLRLRREHLYSGREKQVVGMDLPYEEPDSPDVVIENDGRETPEQIVERLTNVLLPEASKEIDTCDLLEDDLSRAVYHARLRCDEELSMTTTMELASLRSDLSREESIQRSQWRKQIEEINKCGKKLVLYGTRLRGPRIAALLIADGIPFYGFCGRRAAEFPDGLMGKPVVSPEWLFSHADECYVAIAALDCYEEIQNILINHSFPQSHILTFFDPPYEDAHIRQYFEFPELFPKNTAFVDGGCYNGKTSVEFAMWCNGAYSEIYAFEPEKCKTEMCKKALCENGVSNTHIYALGLSNRKASVRFLADGTGGSHIAGCEEPLIKFQGQREGIFEEICVDRLDNIVGNHRIGMIKLDVEGAEYEALQGSSEIIRRDKPLLAICVYHKPGDVTSIIEYCHRIVPEYQFWLRQYDALGYETVLYAAVKS